MVHDGVVAIALALPKLPSRTAQEAAESEANPPIWPESVYVFDAAMDQTETNVPWQSWWAGPCRPFKKGSEPDDESHTGKFFN